MTTTITLAAIALAASTTFQAGAQTSWPDLSAPPPAENTGANDAALIVGIEDYLLVDDVPGAVANADDWYRYLKQTRGLPLGSAVVLRNHEATRESVLSEARDAAGRVRSGGTLWVVFIGHGAPSKDGQDGLLLGADVQQTAESVYARGVSQDELLDALQGSQADTILILDTCFSGKSTGGSALVSGLQPLVPNYAVNRPSALLLSAGRGDQFAGPLPGAARPAFSYLLLGALHGWGDLDGNGMVTATEAVTYTQGALVETVRDRRQTPQAHGDGDVVLSMGRSAGPDLLEVIFGKTKNKTGEATHPIGGASELTHSTTGSNVLKSQQSQSEDPAMQLILDRRDRQDRYDAEWRIMIAAAQSDWLALAPALESPGPETTEALERYVEKYGDASITIDGEAMPVQVTQADEARDWIRRNNWNSAQNSLGGVVIDQNWYEMVPIEPGGFWMGSPNGEEGRSEGEARHHVELTRRFAIGTTEVTQGLYKAVMGNNPSDSKGDRKPVEQVSWFDAVAFCNRLSELEGLKPAYRISGDSVKWNRRADGYRLPTEAEWEYAARAGEGYLYSGSDEIGEVAWYEGNLASWDGTAVLTHRVVGVKRANPWGLYDMTGNVFEWVWDWVEIDDDTGKIRNYTGGPDESLKDPSGPSKGYFRYMRGGGWMSSPNDSRIANRMYQGQPDKRDFTFTGFRLVRSL